MESTATVSIIVRFFAWLLPWLIVRFFPEKKLDDLLEIYPRPTGEAVDIYFPGRRATCWLRFVNLTPFKVQVDRLEVKIIVGSVSVLIHKVLPQSIPSLGRALVFCEDTFDADPNALAHSVKETKARVEVRGFVKCAGRSFLFERHYEDLRGFRLND